MPRPNPFQQTTQLLKSQRTPSLGQKLGLYQVFQRLYDNNPALLDELIALEAQPAQQASGVKIPHYIIGNRLHANDVSLTTNLIDDRSQTLKQPEHTWLIGRAPDSGICLEDTRLSRYHAAIQFSADQGFELVDLGSTNGSFINGEAVRHRQTLQEGDRIRLGSVTIAFFEQAAPHQLPKLPQAILAKLGQQPGPTRPAVTAQPATNTPNDETIVFLRGEIALENAPDSPAPDEQGDRQARLLERLKQIP